MKLTRNGSLGVMMVVSLLLAGCAAGEKADTPSPGLLGSELVSEGTAGIVGQVINTEEVPVGGATIVIDSFPPITADGGGLFAVRGLAPGDHNVAVSAVGHAPLNRTIALATGEILQLQISLERLAGQDPYFETLNYRGYTFCDYVYYVNFNEGPACDDVVGGPEDENIFKIEIPPSWRFIISEAVWTPQSGAGGDSMRVMHAPANKTGCSGGDPCYGEVAGQDAYARIEADPGKTEIALFYDAWSAGNWLPYPEGNFSLGVWVQWTGLLRKETSYSCEFWDRGFTSGAGSWHKQNCWGVGVSTGIPFDLWVTIFHWQGPERVASCCPVSDFTAREDS